MSDNIKLVIEIPKEHYQELFITDNDYILDLSNVADAVKNGIPLDENKGDLISRETVQAEINKCHITSGVKNQGVWNECVDSILRTIDYIPSVENKGEWIPVSERLPKNNEIVLCSAISTSISGGYTRFVGCCSNGFWFVQTDAETLSYPRQYEVIAWLPLPEPYKEGGE